MTAKRMDDVMRGRGFLRGTIRMEWLIRAHQSGDLRPVRKCSPPREKSYGRAHAHTRPSPARRARACSPAPLPTRKPHATRRPDALAVVDRAEREEALASRER